MGTFALFSQEYCEKKSTCILVDAWLQLSLCIVIVIVLGLLLFRLCLRFNQPQDEVSREQSVIHRILGRTHIAGSQVHRLLGTSKISALPLAVIKKDATQANIKGHKNSHKNGADFLMQTKRMVRMDFATMSNAANGGTESNTMQVSSSVMPLTKQRSALATAIANAAGPSASEFVSAVVGGLSSTRRSSKMSSGAPGSGGRGDNGGEAGLNSTMGHGEDPGFTGMLHERSNSFMKRIMVLRRKSDHRQPSEVNFNAPSYRTKQELAELSPGDRLENERRTSMTLREKRRLSIGADSLMEFQVGGDTASVYEIKLKEITLVKRLAFGPLSEVYAAIWRETKVGVKLLMPRDRGVDHVEEAVKNFRREIWVMTALHHPNVLKLIGASLTQSCYVLVMEYMSNGSLYEYLRDEANFFPHAMIINSAFDIASGMAHIHRCGILHRDLKSKNCLLSDNLVFKVADFGLSRFRSKLHGEYTFVGTPFWAAPEVIRHEEYDEKADVYSYGIVLWELVERKDPYETLNVFQVPLQVANDGLRPAEFSKPAPLGLDQLMKQCWDSDPEQRPTFAELVNTLAKWMQAACKDDDGESEHNGDPHKLDLSAHILREQNTTTQAELNRFATSHNTNAKRIPLVFSSGRKSLGRPPSLAKLISKS